VLQYPGAIQAPGPADRQGYGAYPSPQNKEGFVLHSMEGSYSSAYGEMFNPTRQASWHFSVNKDGRVYQHYDPRAVAWHCGGPGDSNPLSAAIGNVALIGIEHEGRVGEPLTTAQFNASVAVQRWCYSVLPTIKQPALRSSHWEHGWISGTSCPSGRIPWTMVLAATSTTPVIPEEDNYMRVFKTIDAGRTSNYYSVGAGYKRHINDVMEVGMMLRAAKQTAAENCYQAEMDVIEDLESVIKRSAPAPTLTATQLTQIADAVSSKVGDSIAVKVANQLAARLAA